MPSVRTQQVPLETSRFTTWGGLAPRRSGRFQRFWKIPNSINDNIFISALPSINSPEVHILLASNKSLTMPNCLINIRNPGMPLSSTRKGYSSCHRRWRGVLKCDQSRAHVQLPRYTAKHFRQWLDEQNTQRTSAHHVRRNRTQLRILGVSLQTGFERQTPSSSLHDCLLPHQELTNNKPSLKFVWTFECAVFVYNKLSISKFHSTARPATFLGCDNNRTYTVQLRSYRKMLNAVHTSFNENAFPGLR